MIDERGIEAVYQDEAYPTKLDEHGNAISSSSQPGIMASMLEATAGGQGMASSRRHEFLQADDVGAGRTEDQLLHQPVATRQPRKHDDILWYSKTPDGHHFDAPMVPASSNRMKGQLKKMPDYWLIPTINNMARERLGYPTQKPEALMEVIVGSSSRVGDIVLDPFAGCGTTLVVAQQMKRQWIGIDISPTAVNLIGRRMRTVGVRPADMKLVGMPVTEADLRSLKPFEFQNWVIQRFDGTFAPRKTGDMGVDGLSFFHHLPIQVKQSDNVGRNVVDNFETAVERTGKDKGYIVGFSFTKGAYEEAARQVR